MNLRTQNLVFISAGPGLLMLALLLDTLMRLLFPETDQSLAAMTRYVFLRPLFELLLMTAVLGLIWMLVAARGYSRLVSAAYLLLGLAVLYAIGLFTLMALPESFVWVVMYLGYDTFTYQAGGALAALGLISLFFWKPAPREVEVVDEASELGENPLL